MKFTLVTSIKTGKKILFTHISDHVIQLANIMATGNYTEEEVELYQPAQIVKSDNFNEVMGIPSSQNYDEDPRNIYYKNMPDLDIPELNIPTRDSWF